MAVRKCLTPLAELPTKAVRFGQLFLYEGKMTLVKEIVYHPAYGERGLGDLYLPEDVSERTPVALTIHGGGWSALNKYSFSGVAEFLCGLGFAVYNIQYRLSTIAPWPACGDDCLEAADFLLNADVPEFRPFDRRRVFVVGASAGGHLALMTGLRLPPERVSGIVSISGIGDPGEDMKLSYGRYPQLFGRVPTEADLERISPAFYLSKQSPPILCTHSLFDTVVPIESAKKFVAAAEKTGTPVETYYYDRRNDGHCIWIPGSDPHKLYRDIEERIEDFIRKAV